MFLNELRVRLARRRARQWMVRLESGRVTERERADFEAWLGRSELNRQAYGLQRDLWQALGALDHLRALEPIHAHAPPVRRPPTLLLWSAGLASCLVIVTFLYAGRSFLGLDVPPGATAYTTTTGEVRHIVLPDGSQVDLGPQTRLEVQYSPEAREIVLKSGEALFTVARDVERPFTVRVRDSIVRAVGTAFNVHDGPNEVTVSVLEGVVEITRPGLWHVGADATPERAVQIRRGEEVAFSDDGVLERRARASLEHVGAWREGFLEYRNAPLERVVADANRYADGAIVIADDRLRRLRLTAVFKAGDLEGLTRGLERILPVEGRFGPDGRIELIARED